MQAFCGLTLQDLKDWLVEQGEKAFRAKQIFEWVYDKGKADWGEMTNISQGLRQKLEAAFTLPSITLVKTTDSDDQETVKFLWRLSDDRLIESVLIFSGSRCTVCVSSQVGCPAKCAFCASGKQGFFRNLTSSEIIEQVWQINCWLGEHGDRVTNIVFMGMGEPLKNTENVVNAIRGINDPERLNIGQRKITVSTVGVVDGITSFMEADLKVNLVLSLHAPNDRVRRKIIPFARIYALEDILRAMRTYSAKTHRDVTYEYILIKGINDQPEHARELATLIAREQCSVNLIPYNPVEGLRLKRPDKETIWAFRKILDQANVNNTCRYTKGDDIAAACGQLALQEGQDVKLASV